MIRNRNFTNGHAYHVYSKSISHFKIFNNPDEYARFLRLARYYRHKDPQIPFSRIVNNCLRTDTNLDETLEAACRDKSRRVNILAYCLMPSHYHFLLCQAAEDGISRFMKDLCSGYSHFFNLRHNRRGPLWEHRFASEPVWNDAELLTVSRYIHLNPTTDYLTDDPAAWTWSSFREYAALQVEFSLCETSLILAARDRASYLKFVTDHVNEQRRIKAAKTCTDPGSVPVSAI